MTLTPRRGPPRTELGVSYIELLMAVAVLAVLATAVLPTARSGRRLVHEKELRLGLAKIRAAIDEYHHDWERGYIESDHEHGWPSSLEELVEGLEYTGPATAAPSPSGLPRRPRPAEPRPKMYLRRVPLDPFNLYHDDWDVSGWRARTYEDDHDSSHWGREGIYDVYSSSDQLALDGVTRYSEW